MRFILSDDSINCYGGRVLTAGIDLTAFLKNPVMLYMHSRGGSIMPIGRWVDIRKEGTQLTAEADFDPKDDFAQLVAAKVDGGYLNAASACLDLKEWSEDSKLLLPGQTRPTVTKSELSEASIVDIPGNPNALKLRLGRGLTLDSGVDAAALNSVFPLLSPPKKMQKVLLALGLAATASEDDAAAAVQKLMTDAAADKGQLLLGLATKAGLINDTNRDRFTKLAKVDPTLAMEFLDFTHGTTADEQKPGDMTVRLANVLAETKGANAAADKAKGDEKPKKTYLELERTKEGVAFLTNLRRDDPNAFDKLLKESYTDKK